MSDHAEAMHGTSHGGSNRLFISVWVVLVGITLFEVFLAYLELHPVTMLLMLIALSVVKAGLIMAYFMHLRFERFALFLTLIPATLFCIGMMTVIFPDSLRLFNVRIHP